MADIKQITIGGVTYPIKDETARNRVVSTTVNTIVSISEADYEALATKDSSTLYVIIES